MSLQIIDADGHINDHACGEEIAQYMPEGNRMAILFPEFDHLHFRYLKQNRRATGNLSPAAAQFYCPYSRFTNPLSSISFKILGSIRSLGLNFLISGRPLPS